MKHIALICLFCVFFSCQKREKHLYSFYYWKTHLTLDKTEQNVLDHATYPYVYVRFFDVDKIDGKFQPIAVLSKDKNFQTLKKIVPTIFMTNRSFIQIKPNEISFLAKSIHQLIQKKMNEFHFETCEEIQIDCDWNSKTKNDYFTFLTVLKQITGKQISCTLRLHQVKFKQKTGIPPVEKVYLMCYSTSSPLENTNVNSILEVKTLKNYLKNLDEYPIKKIDVALPIYSWGIVTNHLGKHKLINALSKHDLNHPNFKKLSNDKVEILKDGFYFGNFLNKGFTIKVEEISDEQIKNSIRFLEQKRNDFHIIYYQLDHKFVSEKTF